MATCTAAGLIHEQNRWRTMDDIRLGTRLRQITKPDKLACFLNMCTEGGHHRLLGRGIARCNILGFAAMETRPGWWSVVVNPTASRVPRELSDGTEFLGDPPEDDIRPEMGEDGGMLVPDDVAEQVTEVFRDARTGRVTRTRTSTRPKPKVGIMVHPEKPKKKKSIYSRKLRTKRR